MFRRLAFAGLAGLFLIAGEATVAVPTANAGNDAAYSVHPGRTAANHRHRHRHHYRHDHWRGGHRWHGGPGWRVRHHRRGWHRHPPHGPRWGRRPGWRHSCRVVPVERVGYDRWGRPYFYYARQQVCE